MNKSRFIAFIMACIIGAATAATAPADAVAASAVAPLDARQIAWGETAGDLQLGVRSDEGDERLN